MDNNTHSSLDKLPNETLLYILGFLKKITLYNTSKVSKRIRYFSKIAISNLPKPFQSVWNIPNTYDTIIFRKEYMIGIRGLKAYKLIYPKSELLYQPIIPEKIELILEPGDYFEHYNVTYRKLKIRQDSVIHIHNNKKHNGLKKAFIILDKYIIRCMRNIEICGSSDYYYHKIEIYSLSGYYYRKIECSQFQGGLIKMTYDNNDNLYITSASSSTIYKYDLQGQLINGFNILTDHRINALAIDNEKNIYVSTRKVIDHRYSYYVLIYNQNYRLIHTINRQESVEQIGFHIDNNMIICDYKGIYCLTSL